MSFKIAICDDNPIDLQFVSTLVDQWARKNKVTVQLNTFTSAEAFLFQYAEDKEYDILLLDIEMERMDGVTLARQVRADNETVQIIFVTGYSEYIAEGYEVSALHFLVKPVNESKLCDVLNRAVTKLQKNEKILNIAVAGEMLRIPLYEIKYLEVLKNYVTVHAKQDVTIKRTLSEFESELDERFYRIGRSYIINIAMIERVTKTAVYLKSNIEIPLPRGHYDKLNQAIIQSE